MSWTTRLSALSRKRQAAWGWIVALLLFLASLGIRLALAKWLDPLKFLTFYPAIVLSTLIAGWPQGAFVLALSAASAWYFFFEPLNTFVIKDANTIAALIGFLLVGGLILLLVAAMRELIRRLEAANHLQDQLFGELEHRVANNLQVIIALLHTAKRKLHQNPAAAEDVIEQAESRMHTISRLNRRLCEVNGTNQLAPILHEALCDLFGDFPVKISLTLPEADFSIVQKTALVLLINEAATNSAKHVFSKGKGSLFEVSLCRETNGRYLLTIRDDGPGIGSSTKPPPQRSFGMGIMETFSKQLGGSMQVSEAAPGMLLTVSFDATS